MPSLQQQIEAALHEFWEEMALADAAAPAGAPEFPEAMDSLAAVDVLLKLEPIVGIELEAYQIIRRGGYDSKEQFLEDLTKQVLKHVEKTKGGAKK